MNGATTKLTLEELLVDGVFTDGDWIESKDQDPQGDVRLIQLADIGDGMFRDRSSRFLTMAKANELGCTFLERNDVLVARMPDPLGRACVFPGVGQPAVTAVDVCVIRPNPKRVASAWLAAAINSPDFRSSMEQFVRGTTRSRISRKNLASLSLPVPPRKIQARIAASLQDIDRRREAAAVHVSGGRTAVERFRQAVFDAACSGRLTENWRGQEDEPGLDLPRGWRHEILGSLAETITKGTTPTTYGHSFTDSGVVFVKVENLRDGYIDHESAACFISDETHRTQGRSMLMVGDVLFSIAGTIGRTAIVREVDLPANTNQALAIIRGTYRALTPEYLVIALQSAVQGAAADLARGSGMNNISLTDIRSFEISVPPIPEQVEIVTRVEALLGRVDSIREQLSSADQRLSATTRALLSKAFRGELVNGNESRTH